MAARLPARRLLTKAIQHLSDVPWLSIGIDTFVDMLPKKFIEEYFVFEKSTNECGPLIHIQDTTLGSEFLQEYHL